MIWHFFSLWILFLSMCGPRYKSAVPIPVSPAHIILGTDNDLHQSNGIWKYKGVNYTGYIIEKNKLNIISKIPVLDGREHGTAYGWYKNGKKKYIRNYNHGDREGRHLGWYENDSLAFEYHFHLDQFDGEQLSYYESGHVWQSLHYINGYEEGKQKSWNDSGRVVNNFTVKNGKLYGVIGRFDCMSVYKK